MTTKPHAIFEIWRPDEVAECLAGVPDELYQKLWSLVNKYTGNPAPEEPCPGSDSLDNWWSEFTAEEQAALNAAATKQDEEYDR